MNIAVAGLWHLGTVTAACLAAAGYRVIGFDEHAETTSGLQEGRLPVFEPGLQDLVHTGIATGRLSFSSDPKAIASAEIVWIAYDAPVDEDDRADVEYVIERVTALFPHARRGALVLLS